MVRATCRFARGVRAESEARGKSFSVNPEATYGRKCQLLSCRVSILTQSGGAIWEVRGDSRPRSFVEVLLLPLEVAWTLETLDGLDDVVDIMTSVVLGSCA